MAVTKYTKWSGSLLDSLNIEDLLDELSQFFLQSGFPMDRWGDPVTGEQQTLRQAIVDKLVELAHISPELK